MKRILAIILCLGMLLHVTAFSSFAAPFWPTGVSIEADGGIVMDANSGAILYGKNIHTPYFPASITKILTALIVIENCQLDEIVTFSENAVYNVEEGSSSAGYDTGDQATVENCLYALVLKSANEAGNALAEHTAGSIDAFADMMNQKAKELGCVDSHFANPSGLNNPDHYTSAYDMALIARAAFDNPTLLKIATTRYHELPPNGRNPEGLGVSPGHKMIKERESVYRPDVISGKTGYTSLAGNTLVTYAAQGDFELVTVVLNGHNTHYTDTDALLSFGFDNFTSLKAADYDKAYTSLKDDLLISGLSFSTKGLLTLDDNCTLTLPTGITFDNTTSSLDYQLPANAPENAVARVIYSYGDREVGGGYLILNTASQAARSILPTSLTEVPSPTDNPTPEATFNAEGESGETPMQTTESPKAADLDRPNKNRLNIPSWFLPVVIGIILVIGLAAASVAYISYRQKQEEEERIRRRQRRLERLKETGCSEAEFNLMMQELRSKKSEKNQRRPRRRR